MSEQLIYYADTSVPTYITAGVNEKIPKEIINLLYDLAFMRGHKFLEKGEEQFRASYFQVFDVTVTEEKIIIRHFQEQPDMEDNYEINIIDLMKKKPTPFTQRLYLIEDWNGTPKEEATPDDHHITMLLPDEY